MSSSEIDIAKHLAALEGGGDPLRALGQDPARVGLDVGQVRHHKRLGARARKLPSTRSAGRVASSSPKVVRTTLPRTTPANPQLAHEALDRAAGDPGALAIQLRPHLVGSVHLPVVGPDPHDLDLERLVAPGTRRRRPAGRSVVGRRGELQLRADRLDPERAAVRVVD